MLYLSWGIGADCLPYRDCFCVAYCVSGKWYPKQVALQLSWHDSCIHSWWDDADYLWKHNHCETYIHQLDLRDVLNLNLSKFAFFSPSSIESSWTSNTSLTTAEDVDVIFRTTIDPHHKAQHFLHDVKYYVPTYVLQFILYCSQGLMTHHRNGAPVFGWQSGLRGVCIFPLGYLPSFHMQKNLKLTALICADDL